MHHQLDLFKMQEHSKKPRKKRITYSLMHTRLRDVEFTERVHVWSKVNAKQIDRVSRHGNDECEFWVSLGEMSF